MCSSKVDTLDDEMCRNNEILEISSSFSKHNQLTRIFEKVYLRISLFLLFDLVHVWAELKLKMFENM